MGSDGIVMGSGDCQQAGDLLRDRFRGCLIGLAVGDALGAAGEFMAEEAVRTTYGRLTDYVSTRWWRAGEYTDDTSMALCIAESLAEHVGVNLADIADRFTRWMLTDGRGIGNQTAAVLSRAHHGEDCTAASLAVWEESGRYAAGNGGVMRCAPVALLHCHDHAALISRSRETCRLTHPDPRCECSCVAVNTAIASLVAGRRSAIEDARSAVRGRSPELDAALEHALEVPVNDMRVDGPDQGYTIVTTQIAFAALASGKPFEDALIEVVSKGGDADTNGAVAGALLGARDGYRAISARWRDGLLNRDRIVAVADELWRLTAVPNIQDTKG
jgi:ADP-ribosyl-[dinitrogen reductase] hydrolase